MPPPGYDRYRTDLDKFGPGIDVVWCVRNNKAEVQSIRFDAGKFTADEARAWLKKHGFKADGFEAATGKGQAAAAALALESCPAEVIGAAAGALELEAQAAAGGLRRVGGTAYTGVPMKLDGFGAPVVVDLGTLQVPRQSLPVLR